MGLVRGSEPCLPTGSLRFISVLPNLGYSYLLVALSNTSNITFVPSNNRSGEARQLFLARWQGECVHITAQTNLVLNHVPELCSLPNFSDILIRGGTPERINI